jgi:hypothetical protein
MRLFVRFGIVLMLSLSKYEERRTNIPEQVLKHVR